MKDFSLRVKTKWGIKEIMFFAGPLHKQLFSKRYWGEYFTKYINLAL